MGNKIVIIFIVLPLLALFIGLCVFGGPSMLVALLKFVGVLFVLGAIGGCFGSNTDSGCMGGILCALIAFICFFCAGTLREKAKLQEEFESLRTRPSADKCSVFLKQHPKSKYNNDVVDLYYKVVCNGGPKYLHQFAVDCKGTSKDSIVSKRVRNMCDSLYKIAEKKHTVSGWLHYQDQVPLAYYADSNEKILSIKNEAWNTEPKAWKEASKANTLSAYQKYLSMYPNGTHKTIADKKVIDIQVSNVFAKDHGSIPAMEQTSYEKGPTSRILVNNNTIYTLTLLYSGVESKRLVIPSHETSNVALKNGTYRIAASVSNSNVRNFAGVENLQGGRYEVTYYIVTSRY